MESQLPTEFDLVVIGTGIVEAIVSAAASRIGKTVLHVDSTDYYGGQWASFNLKNLHNYSPTLNLDEPQVTDNYLPIGNNVFNIKNFQTKWHIPEKPNLSDTKLSTSKNDLTQHDIAGGIPHESQSTTGECVTNNTASSRIGDGNTSEDSLLQENKEELNYTQESLLKDSRKFNIDLVPKLHFARGKFVELLISSNIARYAEYRSVSRVLTWLNGQLEVVPCSRSDVFANNKVSVIEKRMLMKLLTSLDENSDGFKDNASATFHQFLKDRKLSPNLIHYVLYAMSRSTTETFLAEGIENTKRFLNSLGRFGKTPFLFSMYGSGETTQAFCRLSAVFGGVYALSQESLRGIKVQDNKVLWLLNGDQEIKAEHFVFGADKSPKEFIKSIEIKKYISRAIFITDRSIIPSEQEHLTLLMYPPENNKNIVTIIEMGSLTGTCPKKLFLVHLSSEQVANPEDDFKHIIDNLFVTGVKNNENVFDKPKILWSCFFSLPESSYLNLNTDLPENVYICSGPDLDLDYDLSIKKARDIFQKIYPDLEFLPRAPDPEEIIIGGETSLEEPQTLSSTSDTGTILNNDNIDK